MATLKRRPPSGPTLLLILFALVGLFNPTWSDEPHDSPATPATHKLPDSETLQQLFSASNVEVVGENRVRLTYNFETKEDSLLEDWGPDISTTQQRIRWSRGYEGTWTTVEDALVIADRGIFLHKARWASDVKLEVNYLSMASSKHTDVLAAVYVYDKGRRIVGANKGTQVVRLSRKLGRRGKAIPPKSPPLSSNQKLSFGMELKDGVFYSTRGSSRTADTSKSKSFLKKLKPGQVGLGWKGQINGFVFRIVIEGTIDPEWLKEQGV